MRSLMYSISPMSRLPSPRATSNAAKLRFVVVAGRAFEGADAPVQAFAELSGEADAEAGHRPDGRTIASRLAELGADAMR